jgi:hypothetical protein
MDVSERPRFGEGMAVGESVKEEEERCEGARNKCLYLCAAVILPSGASLNPVAAGNQATTLMSAAVSRDSD